MGKVARSGRANGEPTWKQRLARADRLCASAPARTAGGKRGGVLVWAARHGRRGHLGAGASRLAARKHFSQLLELISQTPSCAGTQIDLTAHLLDSRGRGRHKPSAETLSCPRGDINICRPFVTWA